MKRLLMMLGMVSIIFACEELDPGKSGLLVPLTVDEDSSLPSITVNNTKLHAETFGNPTNPMVVFLHGGPGGDYRNALSVKDLANNGYFVVFYDQRGSGLSQRHKKSEYTIDIMFDDLHAVIEHYRTSSTQNVFLFGHSWGAILAAGYINKYPEQITGAIFAEPGGFTWDRLQEYGEHSRKLDFFAEGTNDVLYTDQFITGRENDHEKLDYKLILSTTYSYAPGNDEGIEGPSPVWRYGAVTLKSLSDIAEKDGYDFTANLGQFEYPVLFLYGENNKAYGRSFAEKEAAYFPHTYIAQVNDTGHEMIYFEWDQVYPLVLSYLNSIN